ncbi:DUF6544 family protein [Rhodobacter calidifons]|uniref:Uncharacterized protein n=1 Tax=Rhodobacter calidifons TaxID=2715277 RepID=A0ABX0G8P5_9RHOB|nr:DUF6544 family protein [Rhodobacter calidifons]NHB77635.1 hypothetical protein [Rhodobacter calidifons]
MKGLPVAVLHDFNRDNTTMRVRLAGLVNVVDAGGPELTRAETVTILNDLCLFAPSRMIDPRLTWTPIDETRARVSFALGPNTVSAELIFNAAGELVDFVSDGCADSDAVARRCFLWTRGRATLHRVYPDFRRRPLLVLEGGMYRHRPDSMTRAHKPLAMLAARAGLPAIRIGAKRCCLKRKACTAPPVAGVQGSNAP